MAIRVHLADDHTMFREGLAAILTSQGGDVEVVGQSFTGGDALALIGRNKPDVVITQIDADLHKAKEILSRIRSLSPNSRIIVLIMFDNLHYLQALSKLGIHAYCSVPQIRYVKRRLRYRGGLGGRPHTHGLAFRFSWRVATLVA